MKNKDMFIESFSFCESDYGFNQFEGKRNLISSKYGFEVEFSNSGDNRYRDICIDYDIYIPMTFMFEYFEVNSMKEIEKGFETGDVADGMYEIRTEIEQEIFEDLDKNSLTIKYDYFM